MKFIKRLLIFAFVCTLIGSGTLFGIYLHLKPELPNVDALKHVELQTPMQIYSSDGLLISQFGEKRRVPLTLNEIPKELINAFIATEDSRFYEHGGIDPIGIARASLAVLMSGHAIQGASTITQQLARNFYLSNQKTITRKLKEIFIAIHIDHVLTKDEILQLYLNKIYLGYRSYGVGAAAQVYFGKTVNQLTLSEMAMIAGLPKAPSTMNPIYSIKRATHRRNVVLSRMLTEKYISQTQYDHAKAEPITASYHGAEIQVNAPYVAEMARAWMVKHYGENVDTQGYKVYTTINAKLQEDAEKAALNNLLNYSERHGYRGPQATLWKMNETPWSIEKMHTYLKKQPTYGPLQPAIVIQVDQKQAKVLLQSGKTQYLLWDGLKWARRYISDIKQGNAPKTASAIVAVGQQIWVPEQIIGSQNRWSLSQIPKANTAFVSITPDNGAITALVGGFNYQLSKFNRVTTAIRQVGSNFKPFIYAAGLNDGMTLASIINNAPINKWDRREGTAWRPKNSPPIYTGPTRMVIGLAESINVMAVRVLRHVGLSETLDYLKRFDFPNTGLPNGESLALGAGSMTPLQLIRGYASFANGGYLVQPFLIDRVENASGKIVYQADPVWAPKTAIQQTEENQAPQVISQQNAFLMRQMLAANIWGGKTWRGTGWRAKILERHDIGGKTGTTNESRDTWYSGFAPNIVATVWVGFDDQKRLGKTRWNNNLGKTQTFGAESGGKTALPAWINFMQNALKGQSEAAMTIPNDIVQVRIDKKTGLLANATDSNSKFEYFKKGTQPIQSTPMGVSQTSSSGSSFDDDLF